MRSGQVYIAIVLGGLLILANGFANPARALLASHDCSFCHDFHGAASISGLLKYSASETLCLSCHSVMINDTKAAAIHNPLNLASNQPGYITCRECHNPHSNVGSNIKLVGYKYDPETGQSFSVPTIRVETTVSPPSYPTYKTVTFTSSTDFNITDGAVNGACEICHSGNHNAGQDCTACHGHDGEFAATAGTCTDCHTGSGGGAKDVGSGSPHVKVGKAVGYNTFVACTECHNGHADGVAGANDVEISTASATFNLKYSTHGGGKIQLGGAKTSGSYEAEICWNCHQNDTYQGGGVDISEWDGSHATYNYGSVTAGTLNWLTTNWASAGFGYKNGKLTDKPTVSGSTANGGSTHGVMGGSAGVDAIDSIGCAACHDVHDTGAAPNTGAGPYLRGTWTQNPFPEDGAPRAGVASYASTDFGGVPRGGTGAAHPLSWAGNNKAGGWQIEQNNNAFSWVNYPSGAGLCNTCHTASSIEAATSWTGHNAVVPGFGGSDSASNIFTTTKRGGNGTYLRGHMRHASTTAQNSSWMYGLRSVEQGTGKNPPQYGIAPKINPARPETGANLDLAALLGITVDAGTTNTNYHNFPCSKCHNPHASRLPKLMITNCLDVKLNTWDDGINPTAWVPISGTNGHTAKQLAYASSATNCHRYVSGTDANRETNGSNESGWNNVTPW